MLMMDSHYQPHMDSLDSYLNIEPVHSLLSKFSHAWCSWWLVNGWWSLVRNEMKCHLEYFYRNIIPWWRTALYCYSYKSITEANSWLIPSKCQKNACVYVRARKKRGLVCMNDTTLERKREKKWRRDSAWFRSNKNGYRVSFTSQEESFPFGHLLVLIVGTYQPDDE